MPATATATATASRHVGLTLRTAAFFGTFLRSVSRSRISISKSCRDHSEPRSGCSQKEPMYTRMHSGVLITLPKDLRGGGEVLRS